MTRLENNALLENSFAIILRRPIRASRLFAVFSVFGNVSSLTLSETRQCVGRYRKMSQLVESRPRRTLNGEAVLPLASSVFESKLSDWSLRTPMPLGALWLHAKPPTPR